MGDGAHGVVGDAGRVRAADPGGVGEEGVEPAVAALEIRVSLTFRGTMLERREGAWEMRLTSSRSMYIPPKWLRTKYRIASARWIGCE